jgi:putative tricarboxylic transport membrane protein
MRDKILAGCVILGAMVYLFADFSAPARGYSDPVGPTVFPALVGAGLLTSGLLLLYESHKRARIAGAASAHSAEGNGHRLLLLGMAAWTALYYFAFEPVGYLVATPLYMFPMLAYLNRRKWLTNILISLGFALAIYVVFAKFLQVSLPKGLLGF